MFQDAPDPDIPFQMPSPLGKRQQSKMRPSAATLFRSSTLPKRAKASRQQPPWSRSRPRSIRQESRSLEGNSASLAAKASPRGGLSFKPTVQGARSPQARQVRSDHRRRMLLGRVLPGKVKRVSDRFSEDGVVRAAGAYLDIRVRPAREGILLPTGDDCLSGPRHGASAEAQPESVERLLHHELVFKCLEGMRRLASGECEQDGLACRRAVPNRARSEERGAGDGSNSSVYV